MSFLAPPRNLFIYGTLCDRDLFATVAGVPMARFWPSPASAPNIRAVFAADEPMPVIARGGGLTRGLVLRSLTAQAWRRICFYEDDVYRLAPIRVRSRSGNRIQAHAFWPRRGTPIAQWPWNFREWQRVHRPRALVAAQKFMEYFDAPAGTDLAQAWRDIKASLTA